MLRRSLQSLRGHLLDRMVLRPTRHEIEFAPQQRVLLGTGGAGLLECFVQRNHDAPQPPQLLVLKFPGTAGRGERSTPFPMSMMSDVRTTVWTWNPPGYGSSSGRASLPGMASAAVEFWQQASARDRGPHTSVWLCGNSLGCATALHVAASAQLDPAGAGLILRNPPPLRDVVKRVVANYPLSRLLDWVIDALCDSMDALSTAPQVRIPAVFLQSELDTLVPKCEQRRVIDRFAGPHRVVLMEGLDHGGAPNEVHEGLIEQSVRWLWQVTGCKSHESFPAS
jgi:pimeloyl-ACP methyl ester carboxylesterase